MIDLIAKIIGGATTGYITNNIALKMLFRKYGPFGGVILETKAEFIDNISQLVEDDLINHNTINNELKKEEFKTSFKIFIKDIINEFIYKNMEGLDIKEIPGYNESKNNFYKFLDNHLQDYIIKYLKCSGKYIYINDLISKEQLFNLTQNSLLIFSDSLKNTDILNNVVNDLYDKHRLKNISHFLPENILQQLIQNISDNQKHTLDFEENIFIKKDVDFNLNELIEKQLNNINNKTFLELITKITPEKENKVYRLQQRGRFFLKSEQSEKIIKNISQIIINILKNIDLTITEILRDDFQNHLLSLIENKLPLLIKMLTEYLHDNQKQFQKLIEKAIEEELAKKTGLKNYIKQLIYDSCRHQISKKQIFVNSLIQYLKSGENIENVSKEITDYIIFQLKELSIGEIITFLENNKIINPDIISRIIKNYLNNLQSEQINEILNSKVGDIFNLDVDHIFKIISDIIQKNILSIKKINPMINKVLNKNLSELKNSKIKNVINKNELQNNYSKLISKTIQNNKTLLSEKITDFTSNLIKYEKVNKIIQPELFSEQIKKEVITYLNNQIKHRENKKLNTIYDNLYKKHQIIKIDKLNQIFLNIIDNNLNSILEGNIKKIIATNLNQLSDREVQNSIENFMGKELKPIMLLGALLGTIGGFSLYYSPQLFPGFSLFTYGLVGYITNVIALKMIFLPYQEKRIANIKLPFTPGIVSKNKSRLAHSMGDFINEDLLDPIIIKEILNNNRTKIKDTLFDYLHEDNNQLKTLLKNNNSLITGNLVNIMVKKMRENSSEITERIDDFSEIEISSFSISSEDINFDLNKNIKRQLYNHSRSLFKFLQNTEKRVEDLLPDHFKKQIFDLIVKLIFDKVTEKKEILINKDKFVLFMRNHSGKDVEELFDFNAESILSEKQINSFKNLIKLHTRNINSIFNLNLIKEAFLKTEEVYSKQIKKHLNENVEELVELFLNKINLFLDNNREIIKNKTLRIINDTLKDKKTKGEFFNQLKYFGIESTFRFIDLDDTIQSVIDNLIDKKIPVYLEENKKALISNAKNFINNTSPEDFQDLIILLNESIINENLNKEIVNEKKFNQLIDYLLDEFLTLNFNILFRLLGIKSYADLFDMFEDEFKITYNYFDNHKKSIREDFTSITKEIYEKLFLNQKISILFSGIQIDDWHKFEKNLESLIKDSETELKYYFKKLINNLLSDLEQKNIEELFDFDLLKKSINEKLNNLLQNKQFINDLCQISESLITEFCLEIDKIINKRTEKYFFNLILNSILDSLEKNLLDLFKTIDIEKVTETEVNKMDPEEIETMFNSFAGRYFKRLKLYGWMGSGIGGIVELLISIIIRGSG